MFTRTFLACLLGGCAVAPIAAAMEASRTRARIGHFSARTLVDPATPQIATLTLESAEPPRFLLRALGRGRPTARAWNPAEVTPHAQPLARRLVQRLLMKADQLLPPIVVVDDNDDDVALFSRHLKNAGVKHPLLHFRNGGDAFMFLKQFCPPASTRVQMPVVAFLDVNMQGLSGFDVLVWARQQPALASIRFYMLSGAREEWDSQIATKLGATDYFEKFPAASVLAEIFSPAGVSRVR